MAIGNKILELQIDFTLANVEDHPFLPKEYVHS